MSRVEQQTPCELAAADGQNCTDPTWDEFFELLALFFAWYLSLTVLTWVFVKAQECYNMRQQIARQKRKNRRFLTRTDFSGLDAQGALCLCVEGGCLYMYVYVCIYVCATAGNQTGTAVTLRARPKDEKQILVRAKPSR
jgi:hypothetical protein